MSDTNTPQGFWCPGCHKVLCSREGEICLDCRSPKSDSLSALQNTLDDMSQRATVAALEAWERGVGDGKIGNHPMPENPGLRNHARKYFILGYGLALVDHTMEAAKRMQAAGDLDQQKNMGRLKV